MYRTYAYPQFRREFLVADLAFRGGPSPGTPMPQFDLVTTQGHRVRKGDFLRRRPLLLLCASITCPMVASAAPLLKRLHAEFGDRMAFISLYVREAHPGERYPQPTTWEQKRQHARAYRERDQINWPVAVDTVEGDLHRALDPRANAVYLMDAEGRVAFRSLYCNDERGLREALQATASGRHPSPKEREDRTIPLLRGLGAMDETLALSGRQARRDLWQQMPLVYLMVRLAGQFRPLPPLGRSIAAFGVVVALTATAMRRWTQVR